MLLYIQRQLQSVRKLIAFGIDYRLRYWRGYGIAAPQLGVSQRVIGVKLPQRNYGTDSYILLNPTIIEKSGWQWNLETCLSLPGRIYLVPRYERVTVQATLPSGEPIILEERKFRAAILQHEIDHLDGILIQDYGLLSRQAVQRYETVSSISKYSKGIKEFQSNHNLQIYHPRLLRLIKKYLPITLPIKLKRRPLSFFYFFIERRVTRFK